MGFLAVLFGLLMILFPKISTEVIVILFGILLLILRNHGNHLFDPAAEGEKRSVLKFIGGVLAFLIGIASIALPFFIAVAYIIILAIVAFVIGLLLIILAITESGYPHRWLVFLMGILSIIFAILLMFYPLIGSVVVIGILTGISLSSWASFRLHSASPEVCARVDAPEEVDERVFGKALPTLSSGCASDMITAGSRKPGFAVDFLRLPYEDASLLMMPDPLPMDGFDTL